MILARSSSFCTVRWCWCCTSAGLYKVLKLDEIKVRVFDYHETKMSDIAADRANAYTAYYTAQAGGSIPYYKGAASMRGYGFGSWFMNLFRRAIPIVAPIVAPIAKAAATRFIATTRQNLEKGRPVGDALKQGAIDAGSGALTESVHVAEKKMRGEGVRKRKAPSPLKYRVPAMYAKSKHSTVTANTQHNHNHQHGYGIRAKMKGVNYKEPDEESSGMRFLLYR
jgi:hypothetical protein